MTTSPQTSDEELERYAATYHRFTLAVKWFGIHLVALTAFLTLWFCTSAGFLSALVAGAVIFAIGIYAMNHGMNHSSEQHPAQHS